VVPQEVEREEKWKSDFSFFPKTANAFIRENYFEK